MTAFDLTFEIANRIIPILLTLMLVVGAIAVIVGAPYCRYISLVSDADTDKTDLAKYLAKKAGGRNISTDTSWPSFVPAAKELHQRHMDKRDSK